MNRLLTRVPTVGRTLLPTCWQFLSGVTPDPQKIFALVVLFLGLTTPICAEPAPAPTNGSSKVVQMKPFKITASFDVRGRYRKGTKIIDYAKVTWAAPGFIKAGARKGDLLISIDGKPVSGMSGAELTSLMDITLEPNVKRTFIFKGKRGLFGQDEWTTTAEFVGNPAPPAASGQVASPTPPPPTKS